MLSRHKQRNSCGPNVDLNQELSFQRISEEGRDSDQTFNANFQYLTDFDTLGYK